MTPVSPKAPKLEKGFLIGMAVIFLVGVFSFGVSAYNNNTQEDLHQNVFICTVAIVLTIGAYFFQKTRLGK